MANSQDAAGLSRWHELPLWTPGSTTFPVKYGPAVIRNILPHRPPFLLLDTITQVDVRQGCARGQRRVDPDDPLLAGHLPGSPAYPAALLVEMVHQLGLCALHFHRAGSPAVVGPSLAQPAREFTILHASFPGEALPGDGLTVLARIAESRADAVRVAGQVWREEAICALVVIEIGPTSAAGYAVVDGSAIDAQPPARADGGLDSASFTSAPK